MSTQELVLSIISRVKQSKYLSRLDKQNIPLYDCLNNGILFSKRETSDTRYGMDEPWKHQSSQSQGPRAIPWNVQNRHTHRDTKQIGGYQERGWGWGTSLSGNSVPKVHCLTTELCLYNSVNILKTTGLYHLNGRTLGDVYIYIYGNIYIYMGIYIYENIICALYLKVALQKKTFKDNWGTCQHLSAEWGEHSVVYSESCLKLHFVLGGY